MTYPNCLILFCQNYLTVSETVVEETVVEPVVASGVTAVSVAVVVETVEDAVSVEAPPHAVNAAIAKIANTFFIWKGFNCLIIPLIPILIKSNPLF